MSYILSYRRRKYCVLLIVSIAFLSGNLYSQQQTVQGAELTQAYLLGKTEPLRNLAAVSAMPAEKRKALKNNKPKYFPPNFMGYRKGEKVNPDAMPKGVDPVRQLNTFRFAPIAPNVVIEGIDEPTTGNIGVPDTNGDISLDSYIQIVNGSWMQVFDKQGNALTEAFSSNVIWNEINQSSFSDPIIHYDETADRWFITDLANIDQILYAVSETNDPLGSYYAYLFAAPGLTDYPKYGITPSAYVCTVNEGANYPVYVINRQQLLAGNETVDIQRIEIPGISGAFPAATPIDWRGKTPPPNDNEVYVTRLNDDAWGNGNTEDLLEIWTINIDWDSTANTSSSMLQLPAAPFDTDPCLVGGGQFDCFPQPNTTQAIDGITTIIMNRVSYRNFGTHESFVLNFTVDATGNNVGGIRWMEVRRLPGQEWDIYQEGTFAPDDGHNRFMGAIAINGKGDIGLGYNIVSANKYPSLRFTGRRANDPLGEMTIDEYEFGEGTGARQSNRFGDYATIGVDPQDNSFWFTGEYVKEDGSWGTKVVSFSLRKDTVDLAPVGIASPQNHPGLTDTETVTIDVRNLGIEPVTDFSVGYIFEDEAPVVESAIIDTLFPDSNYVHSFIPTVDMAEVGPYELKIFTVLEHDQNINNDTLRRVIQKLPSFDAGVSGIENLDGVLCDSSAIATAVITNYGTEELTSLEILWQLNAGVVHTTNWTGNLETGDTLNVNIPINSFPSGPSTLYVNTQTPNGMNDEIPVNDGFSKDFHVVLDGETVVLELLTDVFPQETTWQLEDEMGNVIYSGGNYAGNPTTLITEEWCLTPEACYIFKIFDAYGDGISFMGNDGNYEIKDADGNVLASIINLNFGTEEVNKFCLTDCALQVSISLTHENSSGAGDGTILISATSGTSPFQYSIDGGQTFQDDPLFNGLSAGDYDIVVKDANDCEYEETVTVDVLVATSDVGKEYSINVFPNPSNEGVFRVEIEGIDGASGYIDIQIVDSTGRPVLYSKLPVLGRKHSGLVSLYAYPSGTYFIRFKNKNVNELVKIVKL